MIFWKDRKESKEPLKKEGFLIDTMLVSTPLIQTGCFQHSVIFLCEHSKTGAMGIILNKELKGVDKKEMITKMGVEYNEKMNLPIMLGGPVDTTRGFVVHSSDYETENTIKYKSGISITSEKKILNDYMDGSGPKNLMLVMGYAGWIAGQLEDEIEDNSWLTVPAAADLVFESDVDSIWQKSAGLNGIDPFKLSPFGGSA